MENIYISIKCNRSFLLDWLLYSSISRVCDFRLNKKFTKKEKKNYRIENCDFWRIVLNLTFQVKVKTSVWPWNSCIVTSKAGAGRDYYKQQTASTSASTHHKAGLWPHAVGHRLDPAVRQQDAVLARDGVSVTLLLLVEVIADVILHSVPKSGLSIFT